MRSPADMQINHIDITNACPNTCSNCTRFCGHYEKPYFMDFETFKRAVASYQGFPGVVAIMGGEPTIHPEFEKFVRYFRDNFDTGGDQESSSFYGPGYEFIAHLYAIEVFAEPRISLNRRKLFTSAGRTSNYYKHFELIHDSFGSINVNDHELPSKHELLMGTRKELGISDAEWPAIRDNCWLQLKWSGTVTPKGAFFCEVAGAMDMLLDGPGGWPIEPGWWNRKPEDFGSQLDWCELCSACLPVPNRDANDLIDDMTPDWLEKLKNVHSPKVRKGQFQELDLAAYNPNDFVTNTICTIYQEDYNDRLAGTALFPQHTFYIFHVPEVITDETLKKIEVLQGEGCLDALLYDGDDTSFNKTELPILASSDLSSLPKEAKDWVLMMHDEVPSDSLFNVFSSCVFNPGCLYLHGNMDKGCSFFNVRASSLQEGGDLMELASRYIENKIRELGSDIPSDYAVNNRNLHPRGVWDEPHPRTKIGNKPRIVRDICRPKIITK